MKMHGASRPLQCTQLLMRAESAVAARAGRTMRRDERRILKQNERVSNLHGPCMSPDASPGLNKTLGTWQLWGIAVGLVIPGDYVGWSYGWASAGTLGFLVTSAFVALMYATFIFSFTELTTSIPQAGGPFENSRRAFGPTGGYIAGFATLVEFVFAPPVIALAIGSYLNVQFPALDPKAAAVGRRAARAQAA
jgi:amino acid permease